MSDHAPFDESRDDEALRIPGLRRDGCSTHALRRLQLGELEGTAGAGIRQHLEGCGRCAALLRSMEEEARAFAAEAPSPRAAARKPEVRRHVRWQPVLAAAAALALMVWAGPLLLETAAESGFNRTKGAGGLELYVGGVGAAPRLAGPGEPLAPGERVRIGYRAAGHRFVTVISVDGTGEVSPLYPEAGRSLEAAPGAGPHLLPDSVELTGPGFERVIAVFSDEALPVERVVDAARRSFAQAGGVEGMPPLDVGAAQSAQLVLKPRDAR